MWGAGRAAFSHEPWPDPSHRRAAGVSENLYGQADVLVHRLSASRKGFIDGTAAMDSRELPQLSRARAEFDSAAVVSSIPYSTRRPGEPPGPIRRAVSSKHSGLFAFFSNESRWLWVPAVAGTTCRGLSRVGSLMPVERHQRSHRHIHRAQFRRAAKVRQVDDEAGRDHIGADLAHQLDRALRGAAGGDQVVHPDHALAGMDGIGMHLHFVEAVFQRVGDAYRGMRQLAAFANRHETGRHLVRHRAAEYEAARLDAGHLVDLATRPGMHQFIDRAAEGTRVAEQRGDIAKQDSRLRIVRNGGDAGLPIIFKSHFILVSSFRGARQREPGIWR